MCDCSLFLLELLLLPNLGSRFLLGGRAMTPLMLLWQLKLSKWFCDTSTGAATGAARCGSFVGKAFSLLVVSPR
jgi:hypothetical protein